MSIYAVPAIIALTLKVLVVYFYRKNLEVNPLFIAMILVFACHNIGEVLLFWEFFHDVKGDYLLKTYYVISLVSLAVIALYVSSIGKSVNRHKDYALLAVVSLVCMIIFLTDMVVAGSTSLGYSATAVRGDYYWLFQVTSLAVLCLVIYGLLRGYVKADTHDVQIKYVYVGLALLPHFTIVVTLIVLMNLGLDINATMVLPLATTLFLAILLASEDKHRITDIRRFVPFSGERQTANQIMNIFSQYARDQVSYRDAVSDIERLLVEHKYEKNDQNASSAAELMGMPRSSLYSLFNRLDIKRDN